MTSREPDTLLHSSVVSFMLMSRAVFGFFSTDPRIVSCFMSLLIPQVYQPSWEYTTVLFAIVSEKPNICSTFTENSLMYPSTSQFQYFRKLSLRQKESYGSRMNMKARVHPLFAWIETRLSRGIVWYSERAVAKCDADSETLAFMQLVTLFFRCKLTWL